MHYIEQIDIRKRGFFWSIYRQCIYFYSWMIRLICLSSPSFKRGARIKKVYIFSICAIFKNESVFLKEWIEFHLLAGIDHFYLYNNFSEDNYLDVLSPYIEKGLVTLTDWPFERGQLSAYKDCFDRYRKQTEWIAYIDLDEFICMKKETNITHWIKNFSNYPSVYINWKMFGISGIKYNPKGTLVIERYTSCWEELSNAGKSFINTKFDFNEIGCHFSYPSLKRYGLPATILPVNEFKKSVHHWLCRTPFHKDSSIQLNHYYYRSFEQYLYKAFKRSDALSSTGLNSRRIPGAFERQEQRCTTRDYTIQRFLTLLKRNMGYYDSLM